MPSLLQRQLSFRGSLIPVSMTSIIPLDTQFNQQIFSTGALSGGVGDGGLRVPDSLPVECGWRLFFSYVMYLSRFHCTPLLYLPVCRLPLTPHNSNEAAQNAKTKSAATNLLTPPAGFLFRSFQKAGLRQRRPNSPEAASQDSPIEQSAVRVQRGRQKYRGIETRHRPTVFSPETAFSAAKIAPPSSRLEQHQQ